VSSEPLERAALVEALERELRAAGAQGVVFSQALADRLGMNPTDLECLGLLGDFGPLTAGQLAEHTGLTTGAITGVVDRLEKHGYVRRVSDPTDRRRVIVERIPQRMGPIHALFAPLQQATHELCTRYGDQELSLVLDFLARSTALVQAETARLRTRDDAAGDSAGFTAPLGRVTRGHLVFVGAGGAFQMAIRADTSLLGVPKLDFKTGAPAPQLTLRADPTLSGLYEARFEGPPPDVSVRDGAVRVHYRRSPLDWRERAAELVLNGSIPWRIEFHGGAGRLAADLRALPLEGLELHGGVSAAELALPRPLGETTLRIAGGASNLVMHRPPGVAVRVQVRGGASDVTLDDQHLSAAGGRLTVESLDYPNADDRYEVEIAGGASSLVLDTADADLASSPPADH
jgi:DNA-binding MarR family transcriptional regulator